MERHSNSLKDWWMRIFKITPRSDLEPVQRANAKQQAQDIYTIDTFDANLLECSKTQWQFGDWVSLTAIAGESLLHHPDRAEIALFAAAGHHAVGNSAAAKKYTQLALDWGCSKRRVSQILIAGVHNTLARAAAISGNERRSIQHFQASINTGAANSDTKLLIQARVGYQTAQLGLTASTVHALPGQIAKLGYELQFGFPPPERCPISANILTQHPLGEAWAANTVNTVIFRHHGILTSGAQQYTAFYVDERTLRLVQRNLATDALHTHDIAGQFNLRDAHNSISLGIDRTGHLHMCYDHHATQLRYRRTRQPHCIDQWSEELSMTGANEDRVTYPSFILPYHSHPLTLLYRDGTHNKGSARLKTYDEITQTWADHPSAILSGFDQKPWTSNAYWNHPVTGTDGSLHLSFVWRIQGMSDENVVNNTNIGYACSLDNGKTWLTSRGHHYKLPITQVNTETVYPVAPGSNLINQCSMALDSLNRPHIVFYADDASGIPQYQHLRFDGAVWHHTCMSQRTADFELLGGGTLQIPISRPDIVLDPQDNAYVIYRGDLSGNRLTATLLLAPNYAFSATHTCVLLDQNVGYAEPIIDRSRWAKDNILSLLVQPNEQPNHDKQHQDQKTTVMLVDVQFQ